MRRYFGPGFLVLAAVLLVLGTATSARATTLSDCAGTSPAACTINASSTVAGGTFTTGPLTFAPSAVVTTTANLTIHVLGSLDMEAGSGISGNNPGGCPRKGFNITLNVDGDISTAPTSFIRSNSCSGGDIVITNGPINLIDIDGLVESVGSISGIGTNQPPGGGPITITSSCDLTVTDAGKVSSRGADPGADLVRLQAGCKLHIFGLVESTGVGHAQPANPANHCAVGGHPATTACVALIAGDELIIDAISPHNGQVKADLGPAPGKVPWIDIFARGPIQIVNNLTLPFAVHANLVSGTNNTGGDVTVMSRDSFVSATGLAISADATGGGGKGGHIVVQAKADVSLRTDGRFEVRGATTGGAPHGGTIDIRSFGDAGPPQTGSILGTANTSVLDVTGGAAPNGAINLKACLSIDFPPGAVIPAAIVPAKSLVCGGNPTIPAYALTNGDLPTCPCGAACVAGTVTPAAGGDVAIQGTGLDTVASVFFSTTCAGGTAGTNIQVNPGGTLLTVTPPAIGPGLFKVILNLQNGSSVTVSFGVTT